jgi:hypothetical protein
MGKLTALSSHLVTHVDVGTACIAKSTPGSTMSRWNAMRKMRERAQRTARERRVALQTRTLAVAKRAK